MQTIDVYLVRRLNIEQLIHRESEAGGKNGAIDRFATKVGTNADYLSSLLSAKATRGPGDKLMRMIEEAYKFDHGSLDFPLGSHKFMMKLMLLQEEKKNAAFEFTDHLYNSADATIFSSPERIGKYLKMIAQFVGKAKPK